MIRTPLILVAGALLLLGGCNRNTAPGNDREAQIDPAPSPAPRMAAGEALSGIATASIAIETMNDADVAALGGAAGKCLIRLTRIGFPSFIHDGPGGGGVVKLNGKLIPLPAQGPGRYAQDDLRVVIRPLETGFDDAGMREAELILMLPGAKSERGYRGFEDCPARGG